MKTAVTKRVPMHRFTLEDITDLLDDLRYQLEELEEENENLKERLLELERL